LIPVNTRELIFLAIGAGVAWFLLRKPALAQEPPKEPESDPGRAYGPEPPATGTWVPHPDGGWEAISAESEATFKALPLKQPEAHTEEYDVWEDVL
jgi:hypothetical protein